MEVATFPHSQELDEAGLLARVASSSCAPLPEDPRYPHLVAELSRLFGECQQEGRVRLTYTTHLYWGHLVERGEKHSNPTK